MFDASTPKKETSRILIWRSQKTCLLAVGVSGAPPGDLDLDVVYSVCGW
jgi:hypothetical protein